MFRHNYPNIISMCVYISPWNILLTSHWSNIFRHTIFLMVKPSQIKIARHIVLKLKSQFLIMSSHYYPIIIWLNPYCWCLNHHFKLSSRSSIPTIFSNKITYSPKSLTLQSPFFHVFSQFSPTFSMVFYPHPMSSMVLASPVASTGLFYGLHHVAHRRQSATAHITAGEAFAAGRHHAAAVALQRPVVQCHFFTQEIGNG